MQKKKWITPQLIVLVRGKPDEATLVVCKFTSMAGPASNTAQCAPVTDCGACSDQNSS